MGRNKEQREELSLEARAVHAVESIAHSLHRLAEHSHTAKSATLQIRDSKGNTLMPATLKIGQTAQAVYTEWTGLNGTGTALPPAGTPAFSSSDATVATVDPVSGLVTAVGPGTATITGSDAVNGLSGSDVVSDQPITAQSATVVVTANTSTVLPSSTWFPSTAVEINDTFVDGNGNTWTITTAGTTGTTIPSQFVAGAAPQTVGTFVTDGTATWELTTLAAPVVAAALRRK